jgi:hypothetical protein
MANLSRKLLELYAKGDLPGTAIFELAQAAFNDGWGHNSRLARRLAHAGGGGLYRQNIPRDIFRAAEAEGLSCTMAQPYNITLSTGHTVGIFLPHEFFPGLVSKHGLASLCYDQGFIDNDQYLARDLRAWAAHDEVQFAGNLSGVGVLGLHADAVQYTSSMRAGSGKSVMVCSANVISGQSDAIRGKRQPVFVLSKKKMCKCCSGWHTFQEIFTVIVWSLGHLARGTSPTCRHDGSAFSPQEVRRGPRP